MKRIEDIGNELIRQLNSRKDPFNTPIVIFENQNMEQWFKSFWLENENTVLMNVNFQRLHSFILNSFKDNIEVLSKSDLKDYLLNYLTSNVNNLNDEFKSYIYKDNKFIVNNLYDLAQTLSNLFYQYEEDGFSINDEVQKKIYNDVTDKYKSLTYYIDNDKEMKIYDAPIYIVSINGLSELSKRFIEKLIGIGNNITVYSLDEDCIVNNDNISVIGAPSKMREVEYVHGEICKLLAKGIDFKDILVVAPNMEEYHSSVARVFNQSEKEGFVNVPYVFCEKNKNFTSLADGISTLVNIIEKGFVTRKDYYNLITNSTIQKVRNITNDNVNNIMDSIIRMNVYRDNDRYDNWEYSKKRMLLSKLIGQNCSYDNRCELDGVEYTPYSTISIEDSDIITHVRIVEDIKNLRENLSKIKFINNESIDIIQTEFDKWFSMKKDEDDIESNYLYKKITDKMNFFKTFESDLIPIKALYLSLIDEATITSASSANLFSGVTFMNFDKDTVFSKKYLFFMGLSSKNFPRTEKRSEYDLNKTRETKSEEDKKGFIRYLNNISEKVYLSYENLDLRKDEEFFPSTVLLDLNINDLKKYKETKKTKDIPSITIDEKRNWDDLFTRSEFIKKDVYCELTSGNVKEEENKEIDDVLELENYPKRVKLSKIKDYLTEEFQFKFENQLGKSEDNKEEINEEYEPVESNALLTYSIVKNVVKYFIENKGCSISKDVFEYFVNKWKINHDIPEDEFGEKVVFDSIGFAKYFYNTLKKKFEELNIPNWLDNCSLDKLQDITLNIKTNETEQKWDLICNIDNVICYSKDNFIFCAETKKPQGANEDGKVDDKEKAPTTTIKSWLKSYCYSLMKVASMEEKEYIIYLFSGKAEKYYKTTPTIAKNILNKIYLSMYDYKNIRIRPIDFIESLIGMDDAKMDKTTINDLLDKLSGSGRGEWSMFSDKKMVNERKVNGYTKNFTEEIKDEIRKLQELVLILKEEED